MIINLRQGLDAPSLPPQGPEGISSPLQPEATPVSLANVAAKPLEMYLLPSTAATSASLRLLYAAIQDHIIGH